MYKNHHIILLSGPAGSGKDTCFDIIKKQLTSNNPEIVVKQYAFGRPLKEIVVETTKLYQNLELSVEEMNSLVYKEKPMPLSTIYYDDNSHPLVVRTLLQKIGTDILRKYLGDDIFARAIINQVDKELLVATGPTLVFITDLRFPNELEVVQTYCDKACYRCTTVFIERNHRAIDNHNHSSESYYDQLRKDIIIHNNGTMDDLEKTIKSILPLLSS